MGVTNNPTSQILPILCSQDCGDHPLTQPSPLFSLPAFSLPLSLFVFPFSPPLLVLPLLFLPLFSFFFPLPLSGRLGIHMESHPAHTFPTLCTSFGLHISIRQRLNGCLAKNFLCYFSLCELPGPQRHRGRLEMLEMLEMLLPWTFTRHILGSPLCFLSKKKKDLSALSKSAARLAALSCVTHEYLRAFFPPPSTFSFPSPLSFPLPILLVFNERKV